METISIKSKGESINIDTSSGDIFIVSVSNYNEEVTLAASSTDFEKQKKHVWIDYSPLDTGDEIEIQINGNQEVTPPILTKDITPISNSKGFKQKLIDRYYELEKVLKERGLI